jgi:hypothetical protein
VNHDEFVDHDAAYVLGALSPADRRAFEEHLASCRACAREVRQIAGMPGLLASVPRHLAEAELDGPEPVPETLLPRLVREVRRRRARRSWTVGAAAAVAAGALTLGGVGIAGGLAGAGVGTAQGPVVSPPPSANSPSATPSSSTSRPPSPPGDGTGTRPVAMQQLGQDRLHATIAFTSKAWGTSVDLTCAYESARGYAPGSPPAYELVVRQADGTTQQVATWRAVPGQEMSLHGASSWNRADIATVEVRTTTGRPVLRLAS